MWKVFVIGMVCVSLVSASCPKDCGCLADSPRCAAGVSLMLDGCRCCKVCTRQLFEDCSKTQPCDHTKGLECNFGGRHGSDNGICRAKSDGRTCEYNNKIYQNGEIFRPNCKHQCTCMDGAVGCVSLCPHQLPLPKLGCAKPKRVKVQGRCCEQLVCPDDAKTESSLVKKGRTKHNKDKPSGDFLTDSNELARVWRGASNSLPAFRSNPVGHMFRVPKCAIQTTPWSPCSRSCGTGTSTRTTSDNALCKQVKETRICQVRPCNQVAVILKKGRKCTNIEKASRAVKLSYEGCRSVKKFQPRYCGSCSDGRCCRPRRSQTLPVHFQCKHGEIIRMMVMMIKSCICDVNCSSSSEKMPANYRLHNNHKLKM